MQEAEIGNYKTNREHIRGQVEFEISAVEQLTTAKYNNNKWTDTPL